MNGTTNEHNYFDTKNVKTTAAQHSCQKRTSYDIFPHSQFRPELKKKYLRLHSSALASRRKNINENQFKIRLTGLKKRAQKMNEP